MKNIKLKWPKSDDENVFNFGDDLSPYIINKLSGQDITYIHYAFGRSHVIRKFLSDVYRGKLSVRYIKYFLTSFAVDKYIICIGSIIQWYSSSRCIVWGAGIINRTDEIKNSTFLAVRGKYTQAKIREIGLVAPDVIGDPALLLPILYNPINSKKYRLGIIPHQIHYEEVKRKVLSDDILIIKLNSPDIEKVVDEICSCENIISTSLHGVIVAQSYGIKALWYKYDPMPLDGDNVKFYDYFSSVNIPEYGPFNLSLEGGINVDEIIENIHNNGNITSISTDLKVIQSNLLSVAPFEVNSKYKDLIH